jgi:hypothetical protein
MDDENAQNTLVPEPAATAQLAPEPVPTESVAPAIYEPMTPTEPPAAENILVEPTVQAESETEPALATEPTPDQETSASAPTPLTPTAPQLQPSAQQDQTGFIHALLAKAQAKIQSNKQKKLDKIILFAQKKKIIANEDIQKLLHVSSATATRYLVKLVQQGHLTRVGNPRNARYHFLR